MKTISIQGMKRSSTGTRTSRRIRNQGFVPGIIYGHQEGKVFPCRFSLPIREVQRIIREKTSFIEIQLQEATYTTILQDKQTHPVSDSPLHIDLLAVTPAQIIKMDIPIRLTGKAIGATKGGILLQKMRTIKLKGPMTKIPTQIEVPITHLDLGGRLRVQEIKVQDCQILAPHLTPVAVVEIPRSLRSTKDKEEQNTSPSA